MLLCLSCPILLIIYLVILLDEVVKFVCSILLVLYLGNLLDEVVKFILSYPSCPLPWQSVG